MCLLTEFVEQGKTLQFSIENNRKKYYNTNIIEKESSTHTHTHIYIYIYILLCVLLRYVIEKSIQETKITVPICIVSKTIFCNEIFTISDKRNRKENSVIEKYWWSKHQYNWKIKSDHRPIESLRVIYRLQFSSVVAMFRRRQRYFIVYNAPLPSLSL